MSTLTTQSWSLMEPLQAQFRRPHGWLGRLVGWFMTRENRRINQMSIQRLDPRPDDDVLEIGFGAGQAIEMPGQRSSVRFLAGIDPSTEMVEQALGRIAPLADRRRITLAQGIASALPFADGQFSKVFSVSTFHVWDSIDRGLDEVQRVLRPGGRLVLGLRRNAEHPRPWSSPGVSLQRLTKDQELLRRHGFSDVRMVTHRANRRLICLIANK